MRIALGSAQFGLDYGVANSSGQLKIAETKKILKSASILGIDSIDTAVDYGNSEACIGEIGVKNFNIITKLPIIPSNTKNVPSWINNQVENSLQRLNQNEIFGLLLHRPMQLLEKNGEKIFDTLKSLKVNKIVKNIGISIYSPSELDALANIFDFDIIQAPFNLVDNRLEDSGWLKKLSSRGIEIHTRSVFLQGLLLMEKRNLPPFFDNWSNLFNVWYKWLEKNDSKALDVCLSYILDKSEIDKVIVGVDSVYQLQEIISSYNSSSTIEWPNLSSTDEELINPSKWYNQR